MPMPHQPADVFFNQSCPVCGRTLRVRVQLLGQRVYCQHCGGGFTAMGDSLGGAAPIGDRVDDLIARASRAIEEAAQESPEEAGFNG